MLAKALTEGATAIHDKAINFCGESERERESGGFPPILSCLSILHYLLPTPRI
jgi:hypothetical protein